MRRRFKNWWLLQKLSWTALLVAPEAMAKTLKQAALHHEGAHVVGDDVLMRQAFRDKLDGKSNDESAAMQELQRRHNI